MTATAARATALMSRLANAGAQYIMVPNVPPLGDIPKYATDSAKVISENAASANYRNELNVDITAGLSALALQGITPHGLSPRCLDKHHPRYDLPPKVWVRRRPELVSG